MAKFQNNSNGIASSAMDFFVPPESKISGDLQTGGNIRVEGEVRGDITAKGNVYIGENAKVYGQIVGVDIQVAGVLQGGALASGVVTLFGCAKMTGDIDAKGFTVGEGSCYNGNVDISPEGNATAKATGPAKATAPANVQEKQQGRDKNYVTDPDAAVREVRNSHFYMAKEEQK
jgi:cytoskeletal protein CcmA (bactofilin family)